MDCAYYRACNMGMYTGFRLRAKIKPEYREMISRLMDRDDVMSSWERLSANPVAEEWSKVGRCNFIPFGAICYVNWNEHSREWRHKFEDGVWQFQCSLKNYNNEIDQFLHIVLDKIAEEVYVCESQYECASEPTDLIPELTVVKKIFTDPVLTPEVLSELPK